MKAPEAPAVTPISRNIVIRSSTFSSVMTSFYKGNLGQQVEVKFQQMHSFVSLMTQLCFIGGKTYRQCFIIFRFKQLRNFVNKKRRVGFKKCHLKIKKLRHRKLLIRNKQSFRD
jgi:hypothetical protein